VRVGKLALVVGALLLAAMLVLEVSAREAARSLAKRWAGLQPNSIELNPYRRYALRPLAEIAYAGRHVRLDRLGLRGAVPTHPGAVGVVALGDELTFGWNLADEDTYPAQLQKILTTMGAQHPDVLNAGVPGYTSYQGLILLQELLQQFQPRVVVASFHLNDAVYKPPHDATDFASVLEPFSLRNWAPRWEAGALWLWSSARPPVTRWERTAARVPVNHYQADIEAVLAETRHAGAQIIFLNIGFAPQLGSRGPQPRRYRRGWLEDDYNAIVRKVARKLDAPLLEISGTTLNQETMLDEFHPSPSGCRLIAERVAQVIRDRQLMPLSAPKAP
jgi:lysophospholipase L1-like esterase